MQESKEESKELEELFAIIDECFPNGYEFINVIKIHLFIINFIIRLLIISIKSKIY